MRQYERMYETIKKMIFICAMSVLCVNFCSHGMETIPMQKPISTTDGEYRRLNQFFEQCPCPRSEAAQLFLQSEKVEPPIKLAFKAAFDRALHGTHSYSNFLNNFFDQLMQYFVEYLRDPRFKSETVELFLDHSAKHFLLPDPYKSAVIVYNNNFFTYYRKPESRQYNTLVIMQDCSKEHIWKLFMGTKPTLKLDVQGHLCLAPTKQIKLADVDHEHFWVIVGKQGDALANGILYPGRADTAFLDGQLTLDNGLHTGTFFMRGFADIHAETSSKQAMVAALLGLHNTFVEKDFPPEHIIPALQLLNNLKRECGELYQRMYQQTEDMLNRKCPGLYNVDMPEYQILPHHTTLTNDKLEENDEFAKAGTLIQSVVQMPWERTGKSMKDVMKMFVVFHDHSILNWERRQELKGFIQKNPGLIGVFQIYSDRLFSLMPIILETETDKAKQYSLTSIGQSIAIALAMFPDTKDWLLDNIYLLSLSYLYTSKDTEGDKKLTGTGGVIYNFWHSQEFLQFKAVEPTQAKDILDRLFYLSKCIIEAGK